MAWSHPDISLEDLVKLIKGFVDILILASGYQSSGSPASWDSEAIKKAVQWGVFFEQVFRRLRDSSDYGGSVKEIDAVLSELTSGSYFPQGLKDLSSTTLSSARELVLGYLFQSLSLGDTGLNNLILAIIEVDVENNGYVDLYIEELIQHTRSLNQHPKKRSFMSKQGDGGNSSFIIQEILNRQAAVSCLSSTEICMDALLEIIERNNSPGPGIDLVEGLNGISPFKVVQPSGLLLWNQWRFKGLSYLLDKRTVRLLAGTNLIFSAPKDQWVRIFENLKVSNEVCHGSHDNLLEIIVSRMQPRVTEPFINFFAQHLANVTV